MMRFARAFFVFSAALLVSACGQVVYDANEATGEAGKPLAAVVADENSGVASIYSADAEAGEVGLSDEAKTALTMAQNAANSSGNPALIALASVVSAIAGAGAVLVAGSRQKKQETPQKCAKKSASAK